MLPHRSSQDLFEGQATMYWKLSTLAEGGILYNLLEYILNSAWDMATDYQVCTANDQGVGVVPVPGMAKMTLFQLQVNF